MDYSFIFNNLLWSQGTLIVLILGVLFLIGLFFSRTLSIISIIAFLFCFYFFRNPDRICPEAHYDPRVIICPADGIIVAHDYSPTSSFEGYAHKVSIFLSPLDVHVNWTPIAGTISEVLHKAGAFYPAFVPKSSELNERNDIRILHENGSSLLVRQIAGTVARRICCWVHQDQVVLAGYKYGMIKFSSRIDLFLPDTVDLAVAQGQRVYGGQTVFARWRS